MRRLERLSQVVAEFGGQYAETAALGITDEEDAWSRYAFKMATGSGKTKVMSLAIVWSYFHALREIGIADGAAFRGHRAEPDRV